MTAPSVRSLSTLGREKNRVRKKGKSTKSLKGKALPTLKRDAVDTNLSKDEKNPFPEVELYEKSDEDMDGTRSNNSNPALGPGEEEILSRERPEVKKLLEDFCSRALELRSKVSALVKIATDEMEEFGDEPRDKGASYLAAKQLLLTSYCREICAHSREKVSAALPKSQRGSENLNSVGRGMLPSWWRLVELRTIMEKLAPLDGKLKYQTDKLLRLATSASKSSMGEALNEGNTSNAGDDPLGFRPRPEVMAAWGEEGVVEEGDEEDEASLKNITGPSDTSSKAKNIKAILDERSMVEGDVGTRLYRPPRMSSTPYDEDSERGAKGSARGERREERRRDRLRRGEVMDTLREELGDRPDSVRVNYRGQGVSESKLRRIEEEDNARQEFEEDHMVRLTMTRKGKKERRNLEKEADRLETIADVGNAVDFVRVAREAGEIPTGKYISQDRGNLGGRRKKRGSGGAGGALELAMGAVGQSMSISSSGKKKSRLK